MAITNPSTQDKRIIKTKKNIKQTLIDLLQTKSFDSITVTALCDAAQMSRITFYTHYADKYELVEEMFFDLLTVAEADYHKMQRENNPDCDTLKCYCNLLCSVLNLFESNTNFLRQMSQRRNPYLYYSFYNHTFKKVEQLIETESHKMLPRFGVKRFTSFICNGLWAYIDECHNDNCSMETIKEETVAILTGIMQSDIFIRRMPRKKDI